MMPRGTRSHSLRIVAAEQAAPTARMSHNDAVLTARMFSFVFANFSEHRFSDCHLGRSPSSPSSRVGA
jgi:hypothetical protein